MKDLKIKIRHTPNAIHPYIATAKGRGEYGWGNTREDAKKCLLKQLHANGVMTLESSLLAGGGGGR